MASFLPLLSPNSARDPHWWRASRDTIGGRAPGQLRTRAPKRYSFRLGGSVTRPSLYGVLAPALVCVGVALGGCARRDHRNALPSPGAALASPSAVPAAVAPSGAESAE